MNEIITEILALKAQGLKVLGYCRISSEKEDYQKSLRRMERSLQRAGCDEILSEQISGYQDRIRYKFEEALNLLRAREYQVFVIPRIDRMGRRFFENNEVEQEIAGLGCHFFSLDYGRVDLSTPHGWKDFQQASLYAQYESMVIQARVGAAKADRRANSLPNTGRPAFGLRNSADLLKLEIDPAAYEVARSRIDCFLECEGRVEKSLQLHRERTGELIPKTTYRKWLQNPMIRGHLVYGVKSGENDIRYNTHDAIMHPDEWARIKKAFEERRSYRGRNVDAPPHPLLGLVRCETCGSKLHKLVAHGGRYKYIIHRHDQIREKQCPNRVTVKYSDVVKAVNQALSDRAADLVTQAYEPDDRPKSPLQIEKEDQMAKLIATRMETGLVSLDPVIDKLQDEIDRMAETNSEFNTEQSKLVEEIKTLSDPSIWDLASDSELRSFYYDLVQLVVLNGRDIVEIRLKV